MRNALYSSGILIVVPHFVESALIRFLGRKQGCDTHRPKQRPSPAKGTPQTSRGNLWMQALAFKPTLDVAYESVRIVDLSGLGRRSHVLLRIPLDSGDLFVDIDVSLPC